MKFKMIMSAALCTKLFFVGCATDQAAKERDSKSTTLGIWGAAYRPNNNVGVVANLQGLVNKSTQKDHVDEEGKLQKGESKNEDFRNIKTTDSKEVDIGLHMYPSKKSAFFFGLGVERKNRTTQFKSETNSSSLAQPVYANVSVNDQMISVGPSLGYDWIWPNGITALVDIGPRFQINKSRAIDSDSGSDSVNENQRDKRLKDVETGRGVNLIKPQLIVGYSF